MVQHTRGGARLAEQLNPKTRLGAMTRKALTEEHWDYVVPVSYTHLDVYKRQEKYPAGDR